MTFKYMFGIAIAWMMVTQTLCLDVYIDPAKPPEQQLLDCTSTCTQLAPCGIPVIFTITTHCDLYIGNGGWPSLKPLVLQTQGAISQNVYTWDSTGTGEDIRDLVFQFIGGQFTQLRLYSWIASGTAVNVSSGFFGIYNSVINMDAQPFEIVGAGLNPVFEIRGTSLIKNSGPSTVIYVASTGTITIADSTITMPSFDLISGSVDVINVLRSSLNARIPFYQAITSLAISDSTVVAASLASVAPVSFSSANTEFTGIGLPNSPLFVSGSAAIQFTTSYCNFTKFRFLNALQPVSSAVAIGNIFNDFRVSFALVSPTLPVPFHFEKTTFVRTTADEPALELTGPSSDTYLSGNQFDNRYTGTSACSVSLQNLVVNGSSNLVTDRLCVTDTRFYGSLEASFIDIVPGSTSSNTVDVNITGVTKLSSFTSGAKIAFSRNTLHYSITDATQGIDAPTYDMPQVLHLSWDDPNRQLAIGDSWPVFPKADSRAVLPGIWSTNGSFAVGLSSDCSTSPSGICAVLLTVVPFNCLCNPQHSLPCDNPPVYPCTCIAPWTGPTCDVSSSSPTSNPSCPTPQPGPEFVCQHGTWSSNTSITQEALNIPSNSGTIVVNGNLTITQTVIFQGLGSLINVTGCIFVDGGVIVELTDHDIEEIRKGSKTFILMSSVDGNDCESSNDLSLIPINVKTPDKCVKVDAVNSGTKQSLSAIFTISQSKCSSSHLVAILVPSIVGGVIILSAVAIIVILKIRHAKMHH